MKKHVKLTREEAQRLGKFIDKNGGQVKTSGLLNATPTTLSRTLNRHTAPSPLLRQQLAQHGIVAQ